MILQRKTITHLIVDGMDVEFYKHKPQDHKMVLGHRGLQFGHGGSVPNESTSVLLSLPSESSNNRN